MHPTLVVGAPVYILAEAPGEHEDETSGRPLTGPSGRLLRECLPKGCHYSFDNVVNCRPPENRTPSLQEAECCRPRRLKWIEEAKPKLILGLGKVPLKVMLDSTDLQGMRGRLFAIKVGNHSCWFLPTYHPAFILREAHDKKSPFSSKFGRCFSMDVNLAVTLSGRVRPPDLTNTLPPVRCFDGHGPEHFAALAALLKEAARAPVKAIDIETKGLRPYSPGAAIMSIALSFENTHFAFAVDHPKSGWTITQKQLILSTLETILKDDTTKISHNVPFELEWFIWLYGKNVVNHTAWECTQMQSHFLDERRGKSYGAGDSHRAAYQSLDFLCKRSFGVSYKRTFSLNKSDMSKSPLGDTLEYNATDTYYTLRLYHLQREWLKEQGLYEAYLEALPRQPSVALMQALGVSVDQTEVKRIQKQLESEIEALLFNINDLSVIKQYIADKGSFNPAGPDTLAVFKDYLKCPEVLKKVERHDVFDFDKPAAAKRKFGENPVEERFSVDKYVLESITHPLAKLIMQLRNKTKLKSTYVDGLELGKGEIVFPDGKIHCNFNTTFTETGRTSSDSLNMQNFPQRNDSWVRKQIVPEAGHVLVACDYGQLEGCTAAICSKDKALVEALWKDYDIHMDFAEKVAAVYPPLLEGKDIKKLRSIVKNKFVFPAIFGATGRSIAAYLGGIPEHIAEDLLEVLWDKYRGLKTWQETTMMTYYDTGYVTSPTGRRHRYPLTRNQVINFPIQSVACDIVCHAMNELSYMARNTGNWNLHPRLNIHDDLTFSVLDNEAVLESTVETIYRTMLSPPFAFINVPLSVKVSVGYNWFEMIEIGQYWSHKDLKGVRTCRDMTMTSKS